MTSACHLDDVGRAVTSLRARLAGTLPAGRVAAALSAAGRLWERRLAENWTPPPESVFPWSMVRVSLAALLPGLARAGEWLESTTGTDGGGRGGRVVAHVLAGNTPLLAWPGLAASLLAGHASFVKMSRNETLWPRLFVQSLAQVDAQLAGCVHLDLWAGNEGRTGALVRAADAVIAYGGDDTLAALRALTPAGTPFFGHGHALSVGMVLSSALAPPAPSLPPNPPSLGGEECVPRGSVAWTASGSCPAGLTPPKLGGLGGRLGGQSGGLFARDILLYDQGGCLSPHAIFVEGGASEAAAFGDALAFALAAEATALGVPPVSDPVRARVVRQARDLALFTPGATVRGDQQLRWTVITRADEGPMDVPTGHGVVTVLPLADVVRDFGAALGPARARVSSVGVAGNLREDVRAAILAEGASRICEPGQMQAPPLDWPNGGRDPLRELLSLCGG